MISIIDYGVGNVRAFLNIYDKLGIQAQLLNHKNQLELTSKIILPGVGHFDYAMKKFKQSPLFDYINELVINKKIPVLGICVGMQMMARKSEEGHEEGLGWLEADVFKLETSKIKFKPHLPHMGWNDVEIKKDNKLLEGFPQKSNFYFLHSYYMACDNISDIITTTDYGFNFSSIVNRENIYGVQCHPEKSHHYGIKILENFAKI